MNKIVYDLILKLEKCDDFHNRCDYLLEHSEITELLEYINQLQQENKQLQQKLEQKNNIIEDLKNKNKKLVSIIKTLEKEFDLIPSEYVKELEKGSQNDK